MPSGDPVIVDLRSRLLDLVGHKPLPIRNRTLSTTVYNIDTYPRPWPANSIYVGHGPRRSGLNPSPWDLHLYLASRILAVSRLIS